MTHLKAENINKACSGEICMEICTSFLDKKKEKEVHSHRECQPKINTPCLMAVGNKTNPPDISFYELGEVKEYSENSLVWIGSTGRKNILNKNLCLFKKTA
jgi:hypothetical protein